MKMYTLTAENLQETATHVFEGTINGLVRQGELTEEQGTHIKDTYVLIYSKKGVFAQAYDKFFGTDTSDKDDASFMPAVVKVAK